MWRSSTCNPKQSQAQRATLRPILRQAWAAARAGEERARVLAIIAAAAEARAQLLEAELHSVRGAAFAALRLTPLLHALCATYARLLGHRRAV